jgi:hypothetical protein
MFSVQERSAGVVGFLNECDPVNRPYESGHYILDRSDKSRKTPEEIVRLYEGWVDRYPIISL